MSPVSRGRKSKKHKKAQKSRQRAAGAVAQYVEPSANHLAALTDELFEPRARPAWFDSSIARIFGQGETVMAATGPLQLEQVTAELTGAEIYKALHEGVGGLWFDWWYEELVRAAGDRVKAESTADDNAWQVPWRLLHGLAAIGSPALSALAVQTAKEAARALASTQPDWLSLCPDGAVTGQVWTMRDDYGTRFAVLAECAYPAGVDPHVFSFDIDACGYVALAGATVFDSVDQAAAAWRRDKGDAAETARPELVTSYAQLDCLVHCDVSLDGTFRGDEQRPFADNLFRATRRTHDIAEALAKRGQQWPADRNLYRDREADIETAAKGFSVWYSARHDDEPHQEAIRWLAADWMEGTLPDCENGVSPHRVKHLIDYIHDGWLPDEPATHAALELLPEWVRWNGEQADIPGHLIERSAAVAEGQLQDADECPAFAF